jgi:GxxExxY protein
VTEERAENVDAGATDPGDGLNRITDQIIHAAMEVHSTLGPGLLESAYEACLEYELVRIGLQVDRQVALPIVYHDAKLDCGYRLDLLVERQVIIEVKAVSEFASIHEAQVIFYLRLTGCKIGLLLSFNVLRLKDGIRRLVIDFPDPQRFSARSAVGSLGRRRADDQV